MVIDEEHKNLISRRSVDPPTLPKVQVTNENEGNTFDFSNFKECNKRYVILLLFVMVGCYHLGRWTCMVQNKEQMLEGGVVTAAGSGARPCLFQRWS